MGEIPVDEIVSLLRQAIAGNLPVKCVGPTWQEVYAGDVWFWLGDWKIEIFNDCDSFDYINAVESPDGRKAVFEDWWTDREVPICLVRNTIGTPRLLIASVITKTGRWIDG